MEGKKGGRSNTLEQSSNSESRHSRSGVGWLTPRCTARERAVIAKMERYLEKSEKTQVEVSELEHFLFAPRHEDISTTSFPEKRADEGGYSRYVLLETPRGKGGGVQRVLPKQLRRKETHM